MATITFLKSRSQAVSTMSRVIKYCQQAGKTFDVVTEQVLITGVNCDGENAMTEFMLTKEAFSKTGGRNYYHYIQSFDSYDTISAKDAHDLAVEFAEKAWPGYEVLVCTHCDTDNPHSHFVINSVSFETGKKLRQNPNTLKELRQLSDEICAAHGYEILEPYQKGGANLSAREYRAAVKGESWKIKLMREINSTMERVGSKEEYIEEMKKRGYEMVWTPKRKSITYLCPNKKKCRDYRLHDKKYCKERMEHEFAIRKRITEEYNSGQVGQGECRERGKKQSHALRDDALRDTERAAGRRVPHAAGGESIPAGAVPQDVDARDCGESGGTQRGARSADAAISERHDAGDEELAVTGWEDAREIYLRQRFLTGAMYLGTAQRNQSAAEDEPLVSDRNDKHFATPGRLGVGALAGVAWLMEDEEEDPEERRQRLAEKEAAQNRGAAIGLTDGLVLAAGHWREQEEEYELTQEELEGPTMGGMT